MAKTKVVVTQSQNPEEVIEKSVLASAIISIDESFKKLSRAGISRRGLALLVQDNCRGVGAYNKTKPSVGQVTAVLDSLDSLKLHYIR